MSEGATFGPGAGTTLRPTCDPGDAVSGGGYRAPNFLGVVVYQNRPFGPSWLVEAFKTTEFPGNTTVDAYVVCADLTP